MSEIYQIPEDVPDGFAECFIMLILDYEALDGDLKVSIYLFDDKRQFSDAGMHMLGTTYLCLLRRRTAS